MQIKTSNLFKSHCLKLLSLLNQFGFNPVIFFQSIAGLPRFIKNIFDYNLKAKKLFSSNVLLRSHSMRIESLYPILNDFAESAGSNIGHYYHQDLYVAKKIFNNKPDVHLDIGSRVDGFIAHLLAFSQKTVLADVRPIICNEPNLSSVILDLSEPLNSDNFSRFSSISSLHVVEHVGLGRYGDKVDPVGHIKAINNLSLLLSTNGLLYLSFPIGQTSRVEFNAHRVISLADSKRFFDQAGLKIIDFAYVDDAGHLNCQESLGGIDFLNSYGLKYGCGIWTLIKL